MCIYLFNFVKELKREWVCEWCVYFVYTTNGRDIKRGVGGELFEKWRKSKKQKRDCGGIWLRVEVWSK